MVDDLSDNVCFWFELYKVQQNKGSVEDYFIVQGCYMCSGVPSFCDEYTSREDAYNIKNVDFKHIDNLVLEE